ncbi:hypothetical protein [Ferrimonas aestuarii]|uniref:FAD/FMN-containing dehydrogenase n=1 Tax=Ferrimonas aestuarii TaxID=2569539 RepID=A0A4U1BPN5_9GAMM|nr:hypothetical protein [Ferrimonas aestuarii]TKB52775.1 hypothetical protein FCL42_15815 [Ferrimonas aestuarii]
MIKMIRTGCALLLGIACGAWATPVEPEGLSRFQTQHQLQCQGAPMLIVSHDQAGSEMVLSVLDKQPTLARQQLLYVVDRSKVPGLIFSWFVKPALKKRDYPICLVDNTFLAELERHEAKVWLITASESIAVGDAASLAQAIQ